MFLWSLITAPAVAAERGWLAGSVRDATTGAPIAGASIQLPAGTTLTSNAHGSFGTAMPPGEASALLSREGYVAAFRRAEVATGALARLTDARLAPLAPAQAYDPLFGLEVTAADGAIRLRMPAGALAEGDTVTLTPLGSQALPAPLPAGWSPLAAAHVGPETLRPSLPARLSFTGDWPAEAVAARWDAEAMAWRRLAVEAEAGGLALTSTAAGSVALLRPDPAPWTPPEAALGEPLVGVGLPPLPESAAALVTATPEVLLLAPEAGVLAEVVLTADTPMPSGFRLTLDARESYRLRDGGRIEGVPQRHDVTLYRAGERLLGQVPLTPSERIDAALLVDGGIHLEARPFGEDGAGALVGPAGGRLDDGGARLEVPSNALAAPTPVRLRRLMPPAVEGIDVLAAVEIDLGGATAGSPLLLSVDGIADDALLAREQRIGGRTHLLQIDAAEIRQGGSYLLLRPAVPTARVAGTVRDAAGAPAHALVAAESWPLAALSEGTAGAYALAVPESIASLHAESLETGAMGEAARAPETDIALGSGGSRLVSTTPADGAGDVDPASAVSFRFSRPLDPASVTDETLRLLVDGEPVRATVALMADGTTVVLRPLRPLDGETRHEAVLTAGLRDAPGNALEETRLAFTTLDVTPPPRPEAGQIVAGTPDENGVATVSGTQGTAEPGVVVAVRNARTGVLTTTLADGDGGFAVKVQAGLTDDLELLLRDAAGNETLLPIGRVTPPLGTGVLDRQGGIIEGEGGISMVVPAGVAAPDTVMRIAPADLGNVPTPFSDALPGRVVGAMSFESAGQPVSDALDLVFSVDGLPDAGVVDRVPLLRIERSFTVPADAAAGDVLRLRLRGRDTRLRSTELTAELPVVTDGADATPRRLTLSGTPSLALTLPTSAAPGQQVSIRAEADPPYLKLRFPAPDTATGDEQFLLFEVVETDGRPLWSLVDKADLVTLEDGRRVVQTASPPYRGVRKDTSHLVMAMFAQASFAYTTVLHTVVSQRSPLISLAAVSRSADRLGGIARLGVSFSRDLAAATRVERSLYEFSVVPVPAGVPTQISVFDADTNNQVYAAHVEALPPGSYSQVIVLGEDDNPLAVTGTTSQANHAVPLDAALGLSFSHLIDTGTVTADSLYIVDAGGARVPADIRFQDEAGEATFIVTVKPRRPLASGGRYRLVATTAISRPGGADGTPGRGLAEQFELPFTTAPPPQVIGRIEVPAAKTFDVAGTKGVVTGRDIPGGTNALFMLDLADPTAPALAARLDFDPRHDGPVWATRLLPDADFEGRDGQPVTGDLALATVGNGGTFSTVRAYRLDKPAEPEWLATAMVSLPLDVIHESAKLLVIPQFDHLSGTLAGFETQDSFRANLAGIPKTTAIPWMIDTDGGRTAYFINQGLGLMTIDLGRSIPQPPVRDRGDRFGPSYIPADKAGAIVVRDDPSLRETAEGFELRRPAHLSVSDAAKVELYGTIADAGIASVMVNGFRARVERNVEGRPIAFDLELPLREGVNEVHASAYDSGGVELGRASMLLLREFAENPLAGPGTVSLDLPALQVVSAPAIEVTARAPKVRLFDEILVNGQSATAKRCPHYVNQAAADCGWEGVGRVSVPLEPGVNTIVATAIDVDEEFPQGPFLADLKVAEGAVLAVKDSLQVFDSSGLVKMAELPIEGAFRVSLAQAAHVDLDDDGATALEENEDGDALTVFEETMALALVGQGRLNRLTFVDVSTPWAPRQIGWLPTPGPTYRADVMPGENRVLLAAGDAVLIVDLGRANHEGLLDEDGDGEDDRIVGRVPLAGAYDVRVDAAAGLAYVLQQDIGVAVLRLADCARDVGIDLTYRPVDRVIRYATLKQERAALLDGLKAGLAQPACAGFQINRNAALLSQGSSACIWRRDEKCSTAYQPGLSDYDFEFIVAPDAFKAAENCTKAMQDSIHEVPSLKHADVSVFRVRATDFETAYRDVAPDDGSCGAGDDPYGDLCLGRNGLILKWLLEGEWVRDGDVAYDNGIDLEGVLDRLRAVIEPPVDGVVPDGSTRIDPRTGARVPILEEGAEPEPSHIPRLEGLEWGCLEDFALNQSGARLRVKGAGLGEAPIHWHSYLKHIHKAAKAGIRAIYGRLLAADAGNRMLLESTRADYNGDLGCFTATDDPDNVDSVDDFAFKQCESFEEYVASKALLSVAREVRVAASGAGAGAPPPLLTEEQALLAYEMFRRKSDVGRQIAGEAEANRFVLKVMAFIDELRRDAAVKGVYRRTLPGFTDRQFRGESLNQCVSTYLPGYRLENGAEKLKLKVPVRLYNASYRGARGVEVGFYHDDAELKGDDETPLRLSANLAPGEGRFETGALSIKPEPLGLHKVQAFVDPDDRLAEYDKRNNYDGFYYYALYPGGSGEPPPTPGDRPESPVPIPDPPASKACLVDGKAPRSPWLELSAAVNGQPEAAVPAGTEVRLDWILRNLGNADLADVTVEDSLAGSIAVGALPVGKAVTVQRDFRVPDEPDTTRLGISTATARDADGNGIGPTSAAVKLSIVGDSSVPVVRILSPPRQDPPYATMAGSLPVSGVVKSEAPIASLDVNGVAAEVSGEAPLFHFRTVGQVELPAEGENTLVAEAVDSAGNAGRDETTVERLPAEALRVVKRVNGQARVRAAPGETVTFTVAIENTSAQALHDVNVVDAYMGELPAPFDLAAGAERTVSYDYTIPADSGSDYILNEARVLALDATGGIVGPVTATAQVDVGGLILRPRIILMGDTTGGPRKKALTVIRTEDGENVAPPSRGTSYWYAVEDNWKTTVAEFALTELWNYFKRASAEGEDKKKEHKLPVQIAKVTVDENGNLVARSNGINVIRAIHKSPEAGDEKLESNYAIVIAGIVGIDSIEIEPRSLWTAGPMAAKSLTNMLAERIRSESGPLIEANPPMLLTLQGPVCDGDDAWSRWFTDWLFNRGYLELTSVKLKFLHGPGEFFTIKGPEILGPLRKLSKLPPPVVVPVGGVPVPVPVGWLLYQLFEHTVTQTWVNFETKDQAVQVRNALPSGVVTALKGGTAKVTGELDLSKWGFGKAKDDVLVLVGPKLYEVDVRRDPTKIALPGQRAFVQSFAKLDFAAANLGVVQLPKTKDILDYVVGYNVGRYLDKLIPGGLPGSIFTGSKTFTVLADDPMRLDNVWLEMTLELTSDAEIKIADFRFGFPAPNFMSAYKPIVLDDGTPGSSVAEMVPGPGRDSDWGPWLRHGLQLSREVEGKGEGRAHLGVETCLRFVGRATDLYDVAAKKGGAAIQVGARAGGGEKPVASARAQETHMNRAVSFPISGRPFTEMLDFRLVMPPAHGTLRGLPARGLATVEVTYEPDEHYVGEDFFAFLVANDAGESTAAPVNIRVLNEAPRAVAPAAGGFTHDLTPQGEPVRSTMIGEDDDRDELTIAVLQPPAHGQVTPTPLPAAAQSGGRASIAFTYTPRADFSGTDTLAFQVSDGAATDTGTIVFQVNAPPVCRDVAAGPPVGRAAPAALHLNASDADGHDLSFRIVRGPEHGTASLGAATRAGTATTLALDYRAHATATAEADSFTVVASDGIDESEPCTVSVALNRPPTALGQSLVVQKNAPGTAITLQGEDEAGAALRFDFPAASDAGGIVDDGGQLGPARHAVIYTPAQDYTGEDGFAFSVNDGLDDAASPAAVTIRVNAPPVAVADEAVTDEDQAVTVDVLANDTDPDGVVVGITGTTGIAEATVEILPAEGAEPRKLRFTPRASATGEFAFDYRIEDNDRAGAVGRVRVLVNAVNDPPEARDDAATTNEDEAVEIAVLANDSDPDGDPLSVDLVDAAGSGRVENLGGRVRYTPGPDFNGTDGFAYTVADGHGGSAKAKVTVTVAAVNDPPHLPPTAVARYCCLPSRIDVLRGASDPDGEIAPDSLAVTRPPRHGTARIENGQVVYTPRAPFTGNDALRVRVADDGGAESEEAEVEIAVLGGFLNEIVPESGKLELHNRGLAGLDLQGWRVGGYVLGSEPAREAYFGPAGEALAPGSFALGGYLVVDLGAAGLAAAPVELVDARGRVRDRVDPGNACFAAAKSVALSRRPDETATGDPCLDFRWLAAPSLGRANP